MTKYVIKAALLGILVIGALDSVSLTAQEPHWSRLNYLKDPRISTKKNERMLMVQARGDPNIIGAKAFGLFVSTVLRNEGNTERSIAGLAACALACLPGCTKIGVDRLVWPASS